MKSKEELKFKNRQIGAAGFVANKIMENMISEFKQETLEEAAAKHFNKEIFVEGVTIQYALQEAFIDGAKWQQERMYSEEEVFGKVAVVIEYDRLQTGSIVKLHPNKKGQAINGTGKMNLDKAVNIVFANTPHSIDYLGKFVEKCYYDSYYTFEQDGIFARYSTNELDYIAEVIEY